jgi:hypothetical protein
MRRAALALLVVAVSAIVAAGCGGTRTVTRTVTVDSAAKRGVGAPLEHVEFGHVRSLTRRDGGFVMRFDPAWFLSGATANAAAAEDGAVLSGQPVPNDNYRVDEGHRLLTYLVSATARVTVLARGVAGTRVTVAQLARLVRDENALGRPLFEPITTGFWIRVRIDTVRSIDQQYLP